MSTQAQEEKSSRRRGVDYAIWAALVAFLLYRFVWPSASAPISPKLAAAAIPTHGQPVFVEFSSRR